MPRVPDITTSRNDIVVDEVRHRPRVLSLFGVESWEVRWRCVSHHDLHGISVLTADQTYGSASLGGVAFSFLVNWREDLRRIRGRSAEDDVVTPSAVLNLAEVGKQPL